MNDRHYGHLARDGHEQAIKLLDTFTNVKLADVHAVHVGRMSRTGLAAHVDNEKVRLSRRQAEAP